MSAAFIGLDLAKSVFPVHGVDINGKVVVTKRLRCDGFCCKVLVKVKVR
jgi:hypothetical protein